MIKPRFDKKSKRWIAEFRHRWDRGRDENNKIIWQIDREVRRFRSKADALAWTKKMYGNIAAFENKPPASQVSLTTAIEAWLAYCQRWTKGTQAEYKLKITTFTAYLVGQVATVNELERRHLTAYESHLLRSGKKPTTANSHLTVIKSFCKFVSENYNIPNPSAKWPFIPVPHQQAACPTKKQYEQLLKICPPDLVPVIRFLANTGLRISEFLSLVGSNYDSEKKSLIVNGKGNKSRTIGANSTVRELINGSVKPDELVYMNLLKSKTPLTRNMLYQKISVCLRRVGLRSGGVHSLRHFFATQLLTNKVPLSRVSKLLGHSNVLITQRAYDHLVTSDFIDTTDVLDL